MIFVSGVGRTLLVVVIPSVVAYLILTRLIVESGDLILISFPALGRENLGGWGRTILV